MGSAELWWSKQALRTSSQEKNMLNLQIYQEIFGALCSIPSGSCHAMPKMADLSIVIYGSVSF